MVGNETLFSKKENGKNRDFVENGEYWKMKIVHFHCEKKNVNWNYHFDVKK